MDVEEQQRALVSSRSSEHRRDEEEGLPRDENRRRRAIEHHLELDLSDVNVAKEMKRGRDDKDRDDEEEYFGECCHERVNGHCLAAIIAGVLSSTLSWYCWGLAMSTPGGPFVKALQPQMLSVSHKTNPIMFYSSHVGRLVGGLAFGHVGDRQGHHVALVWSLLLVSLSTMAMACFPFRSSKDHLVLASNIAWTSLRFLQGLGIGGQWPGSILLPIEECRTEKTGALVGAIAQTGLPLGLAAATLAGVVTLKENNMEAWRAAFYCSILLLPIVFYIYRDYAQGHVIPDAQQQEERHQRSPVVAALSVRSFAVLAGFTAVLIDAFIQSMLVFNWPMLAPSDNDSGFGGLEIRIAIIVGLLSMAFLTVLTAYIRERFVHRCTLYRTGASSAGILLFAWIGLVKRGSLRNWILAYVLVLGFGLGILEGPLPTLLLEPFPSSLKYAGPSLAYHGAHVAVALAYPSLADLFLGLGKEFHVQLLLLGDGVHPLYLALFVLAVAFGSALASGSLKGYLHQPPPSLLPSRSLRLSDCVGRTPSSAASLSRVALSSSSGGGGSSGDSGGGGRR